MTDVCDENLCCIDECSALLQPVSCSNNELANHVHETVVHCQSPHDGKMYLHKEITEPMHPIGPWATGKCDWNPSSGLTGVKPIVDHYSITQFSANEWMQRNHDIYDENQRRLLESKKNEDLAKNHMAHANATIDSNQESSTKLLRDRTHSVYRLQTALERAIKGQMEEYSSLAEQRCRLLNALIVLKMPESIASECITRRGRRPESELIRDGPEEELIEELALISEIRNVLNRLLQEVDAQQSENKAAQERLEHDWSDKTGAYQIDSINSSLKNTSSTILFKPGATRYMDEQSTEERWFEFTRQVLTDTEENRKKSVKLRENIDAVLLNASRDLRVKADNVVISFQRRITTMDDARVKLEVELVECLKRLAETERLIETLTVNHNNFDYPMKMAQTRLENRKYRNNVENCRDRAQIGLVTEVKKIEEGVHSMTESIQETEKTKETLLNTRGLIERELMLKRRSIQVDKERCLMIRNHFPSTAALSGYP